MTVANPPKFLHENRGCNDVSTFALHRFDKDGRDFFRRKNGFEQFVFEEAGAAESERFGILRSAFASAIHIRIADVGHSRKHGTETALLLRLRAGQRERAHSASMKRAEECDDVLTLRVVAREL
jgi:hypothetical protein